MSTTWLLIVLLSIPAGQPWPGARVAKATAMHEGRPDSAVGRASLLEEADAERILGESVKLVDRSSEKRDGRSKVTLSYTGLSTDTVEHGRAHLYYVFEEFADTASARKNYAGLLTQNRLMDGLRELKDVGDDAFLHTDNRNFALIIARKGRIEVRIKVNRLTPRASVDELRKIVRRIVSIR